MKKVFGSLNALLLFLILFSPSVTQACSVCFGKSESNLSQGMKAGVVVLLGVVVGVLGGIACFFYYLARRNRMLQEIHPPAQSVETAEKV